MKEFLVGLIFLIAVAMLFGIGILLFPFVIILHFLLRAALVFVFIIAGIWLLGKFIIFIWKKLKG